MPDTRPAVKLVGEDGNAFAIMGRAARAARQAGWSKDKIKAYTDKATAGDYNNLLAVTMQFFNTSGDESEDEDDDIKDADWDAEDEGDDDDDGDGTIYNR